MDIEDYFLNLAWIWIPDLRKENLLDLLNLKIDTSTSWQNGHKSITNSFDEKTFLNFEINGNQFLIGKYFFIDQDQLVNTLNKLSKHSQSVHAFAIDVWSNYFCYAKSIDGNNVRLWIENDEGVIEKGKPTKEESTISEKESANKILELADMSTTTFHALDEFLNSKEVLVLK